MVDGYDYLTERSYGTPAPSGGKTGFDAAKAKAKASEEPTVRTPNLAYQRMAMTWADVAAVRGGTQKMRECGEAYLPKEPTEGDDAYAARLNRATLSPLYKWLVRGFAAMILRKPIKVKNSGNLTEADYRRIVGYHPDDETTDPAVTGHLEDLDRMGSDLQQLAFEWLCEAIHYGHAVCEISYPDTEGIQTLADEQGLQPRWSIYPATGVLGERGGQTLSQVRLLQYIEEPVGEWGDRSVEQVMAYRYDGDLIWQIWRESEDDDDGWYLHEAGVLEVAGEPEIPVVYLYSDRKGRITPPPMLEVLYLNIRHYQVSADIDQNCHIAAMNRLFIFGETADNLADIGAVDEAICLPNPEARAEWLAAKIDAFEPNNIRLGQLEQQMLRLGLGAMTAQKNVGESAEAKRLDRTQGDSQLAILAQNLQTALNQVLQRHCAFIGIDPTQAPTVEVSRDFDLTQLNAQMLGALTNALNASGLSRQTFWELLQRGEIGLPDNWSPEIEKERLDEEIGQQTAPPTVPNGVINRLDRLQDEPEPTE